MEQAVPELRGMKKTHPKTEVSICVIRCDSRAEWQAETSDIADFVWKEIECGPGGEIGKGILRLRDELESGTCGEQDLPPVILLILLSEPADAAGVHKEYAKALRTLEENASFRDSERLIYLAGAEMNDREFVNAFAGKRGKIFSRPIPVASVIESYAGWPEEDSRVKRYTEKNHPGRKTCDQLRAIRKKIAEENGIDFVPAECHHTGPCEGSCPVCDAEVRYLDDHLRKLEQAGKKIHINGIAKDLVNPFVPISSSQAAPYDA